MKIVTQAGKAMGFAGNIQGLAVVPLEVAPGKPVSCSGRKSGIAVGFLG